MPLRARLARIRQGRQIFSGFLCIRRPAVGRLRLASFKTRRPIRSGGAWHGCSTLLFAETSGSELLIQKGLLQERDLLRTPRTRIKRLWLYVCLLYQSGVGEGAKPLKASRDQSALPRCRALGLRLESLMGLGTLIPIRMSNPNTLAASADPRRNPLSACRRTFSENGNP
jgi:hypothetical protein